ncbi:MAG: PD-(D/E)XK nuclease family protein [Chlamydiota bacterium]
MVSSAKRLTNEFSWSFSRHSTFDECQKKYWYTYYGAWEGWEWFRKSPPQHARILSGYLYAMKNMQSLAMYVGSVVHETIENTIKDFRQLGQLPPLSQVIERGQALFLRGIEDARQQSWRRSPKKFVNILEVYYHDLDLSEGKILQAQQKIERCLSHWYHSPVVQALLCDGRASFLGVEELDSFYLDDTYKIWVVIDLALRWNKEQVILFDWKTGSERRQNLDQLYTYALFAQKKWGAGLEKIVLSPFYLDSNVYHKIGANQQQAITSQKLEEIMSFMRSSCEKMTRKLEGPLKNNQTVPENFTYTDERRRCRSCPFRELCETINYRNMSQADLEADAQHLI